MARGLDHVVHAVHDLDAAAEFYRRLGFTVGARNRHPWGTHNRLVQLPGFFVELLTVAEPEKFGDDGLAAQFGVVNRRFLDRQEGLSFLILEGRDAAADARDFRASGIAASDALRFDREGRTADGTPHRLGFSLAFARDAGAPWIGFATCQHHAPERFWETALQQHGNGTSAIAGAVMVAENPSDHHIFLSAFTGVRDLHATSNGVTASTPRGDIQIMDAAAFHGHFGLEAPDVSDGARLAALVFEVKDQRVLIEALEAGAVPFFTQMRHVVISPDIAMGATLAFES